VEVMLKMLICRNYGAAKSGLPRPLQVRGANGNNHRSDNEAFGSTKSTKHILILQFKFFKVKRVT
jgi:hypothetical protein